ncbi:class I SAM-dependent methyltransferase [Pedobacter sp. SYP-B3415]|uniref:class I SAM-dependent methyltransferase n=1 Tax=Pedobacter sp. SYP-B3415 TaxID=2496641 RepID=UPI00101B6FB8|nr:class I SAM-dependent methyltransferase [Pedobacter sp. SYP-B3415]
MKTESGYDRISGIYDQMSRLIFGRAQVRAQTDQLDYLAAGERILIVGGGTGWILDELGKITRRLHIVYLEQSSRMVGLSKKREPGKHMIEFVTGSAFDYNTDDLFDVVFTPFIFDHFDQTGAEALFTNLHRLLRGNGLWVYTDFCALKSSDQLWKRLLMSAMYAFFRQLNIVKVKGMPDIIELFEKNGYRRTNHRTYYGKLIESCVYVKREKTDFSL